MKEKIKREKKDDKFQTLNLFVCAFGCDTTLDEVNMLRMNVLKVGLGGGGCECHGKICGLHWSSIMLE